MYQFTDGNLSRQDAVTLLRETISKMGQNMTGKNRRLVIDMSIQETRDMFVSLHDVACWLEDQQGELNPIGKVM